MQSGNQGPPFDPFDFACVALLRPTSTLDRGVMDFPR